VLLVPRCGGTGLRNLPRHGFARSQLWCEIAALAGELTAWTQLLAPDGPARRSGRQPKIENGRG
jgi:hypothetical protein